MYIGNYPVNGDSNNSFKLLDDISSYTLSFNGSSASDVSTTNDTITQNNHRFLTGQRVTYTAAGTVIGGLTSGNVYFVIKTDYTTFKLATSYSNAVNSVAIDLTALGTGTHSINVAFDGFNTRFKTTYDNGARTQISRAAQLQISVNGVIQQPNDTSTPTNGFGIDLDSVVVFSAPPAASDVFWGNVLTNNFQTFDISDNSIDSFTANGSQISFSLSKTPANSQNVLVTINGVVQYPTDGSAVRSYSVDGNVLIFSAVPSGGSIIQVRHIGFAGPTSSNVTGFYGRTGNVGLTTADAISVGSATIGVGAAGTSLLVQGNARITGILTIGTGSITFDGNTNTITGISTISAPSISGVATFSTGPVLIGSGTSTGTASQRLQVTGGAYVSGNTGIGTTNPQTRLEISGVLRFTGNNIRIGDSNTGSSITSGSQNFFAGNNAGGLTAGGSYNNFLGNSAGYNNTTGSFNNFLGYFAGQSNATGSNNNFFGDSAGLSNTSGDYNNFFGASSGWSNKTGSHNNFLGNNAGFANTSGSDNIFIGQATGNANVTGSENVIIGKGQNAPILNGSNQLVIGAGSTSWITGNSSYNIGIGTTNPGNGVNLSAITNTTTKLDVRGKTLLWNQPNVGYATAKSDMDTYAVLKLRGHASDSTNMQFAHMGSAMGVQVTNAANTTNWDILLNPFGGNLGVGITNPTAKLQVVGSTDLNKLNLSGISSSISSTAVDVFVYDTRKDSDGGQWRKRTQHTSWYNETLNTATRGSRRDFPAVAVIVATTTSVTIYDGDDPDLPMWMVFESSGYGVSGVYMFNAGNVVNSSVYALNGILVGGQYQSSDHYGSPIINFISEKVVRMDPNSSEGGLWLGNIATRNTTAGYASQASSGQGYLIVDSRINDVAMTVLPNAPIDAATGLPVPTIIVGTNGGVSIIKDDGSIFNGGGIYHSTGISLSQDSTILYSTRVQDPCKGIFLNGNNFALSMSGGNSFSRFSSINISGNSLTDTIGDSGGDISSIPQFIKPQGLGFVHYNATSPTNSLVAYATTSYNTGWMHGDIKGAWLSDTSTASVTGTELHPNGNWDFSSTNVSYISNTASGTATVVSGQLQLSGGTSNYSDHIISITTVVGKQYVITIDYITAPGGTQIGMYHQNTNTYLTASDGQGIAARSSGTKLNWYFTALSTTTGLDLVTTGTTSNIHVFDNWSIRLAEPDRSVNNKGLAVYGTITKTAVATGSNLVAYSGFSASNYLFQPYNSALDFGTGDFCYMGWVKDDSVGSGAVIFQRGAAVNSNESVFYIQSDFKLIGRVQVGGNGLASDVCFIEGQWNFVVFQRRGTIIEIYHNGVLRGSKTNTETMNQSGYGLSFGAWLTNNSYFPTSMALWRASATAPSPTQIAKIYNDEKVLFQENSQCTLYGASDAVTALAYDDSNSLLSVGTSSGRSDFRGLERINNTTTAVTTAISASNGLIAEQ